MELVTIRMTSKPHCLYAGLMSQYTSACNSGHVTSPLLQYVFQNCQNKKIPSKGKRVFCAKSRETYVLVSGSPFSNYITLDKLTDFPGLPVPSL